jgi:arginase
MKRGGATPYTACMRVHLVDVPYDCGQFNVRMGAGPAFLIARGLEESLSRAGHDVRTDPVRLAPRFHTEWDALVALQGQIAAAVRSAMAADERALVLSGNCGPSALGAMAALGSRSTAVCWFDAHGDFNTAETSPSGFLDGMALAIATGQCWRAAAPRLQAFDPVPEEHVFQIGVRSTDPDEEDRLERSRVTRLGGGDGDRLSGCLQQLPGATALYLHVDLDVIDSADLRANSYACPRGLSVDQLIGLFRVAAGHFPAAAASLTALDPGCDEERAWPVVERIAHALADLPTPLRG